MTANYAEEAVMITEDRIWDARSLLSRRSWKRRLPDEVGDEFRAFCARFPDRAADLEACQFDPVELPSLSSFADEIRRNLLTGDGVAWTYGLDELELTEAEQRLFYFAFGSAMGEVMTQYGLMFPVRDRGLDYKEKAIPVSMTGAETRFHTDSSSADVVPDFVGLLCENPSTSGGESLVTNALIVHQQMQNLAPAAVEVLGEAFIRDIVTPGKEKTQENLLLNRFPVFAPCDRKEGLLFRYMRYWIEKGQERAGEPLDHTHLAALDTLDDFLAAPENVVSFRLQKGDILWVNNRTVAHNRTAFRDSPGNVRQLQRMWIQARL